MTHTYILDTSALITDPTAFKSFHNSNVLIPITVLNELDNLKTRQNEVARAARAAIRAIDEVSELGDISTGILLENDILLKVETKYYDSNLLKYAGFGDPTYGDTQILICASEYFSKNKETTLISNDINLRIKAKSRGLTAKSHTKTEQTGYSYLGVQTVNCEEGGLELQQNNEIIASQYGMEDLFVNECVLFEDENRNGIAMGRKVSNDKIKLIKKNFPWSLSSRNKEQAFAIDLIMDKNIDLVTMTGAAGCGKTIITLASALELVINKKEYDKLIIYRPIQAVGKDVGYLPGPQPLDAKILTPYGWSTMGEVQKDSFVIGSDGTPKKVIEVFPKGKKEIFKVEFSDGSSTECCDDHLWYTSSRIEAKNNTGSVKSLKQIKQSLKDKTIWNHSIPMIEPVKFEEKETIIDPYILGVLIGDGTLSEKYSIYFTSSDEQMQENCAKQLPLNMICNVKSAVKNSKNYSFIMKNNLKSKKRDNNIFNQEIKRLGLSGSKSRTKFIPDLYKFNSIEKRLAILQGLMDTDGFVSKNGDDISYSTTSKILAEDVQFIVQSLGGKANISNKISNYNNLGINTVLHSFVVSVSLPKEMCPFRLTRKINRFKPRKNKLSRKIVKITSIGSKEAKCILIDSKDHLYATDHCILTHNTLEEKLAPWFQAIMDNFEILFANKSGDWKKNLEMFQKKGRIEMDAITFIRGRSIPNAIIYIDECQNFSKDEIKTVLTRAGEGSKIILSGDIEQIDSDKLDFDNNGLSYVIDKFKDYEHAGHISLVQGERSRLATKAAQIL